MEKVERQLIKRGQKDTFDEQFQDYLARGVFVKRSDEETKEREKRRITPYVI